MISAIRPGTAVANETAMRIHSTILVAGVAAVLTLRAPAAHACGQGGSNGAYAAAYAIAFTALAADTGFTLYSAGSVAASHKPSAGYGVAELLIAGPQFAIGVANLNKGAPAWYATWMGALTVHAIWTIATASVDPSPARLEDPQSHAFAVGPTIVAAGQQAGPGLGFTGRF